MGLGNIEVIMPTPVLSEDERQRRKAAVEAALRDGYAPFRQGGGKGSAVEEAGKRTGLAANRIASFIRAEESAASRGEPNYLPDWSLYIPEFPEPAEIEQRSTEQNLRDEITRLNRELKAAYRAGHEEDAILNIIGKIAKAEENPPDWLTSTSNTSKSLPEVPVTIWSDWHYGEVIHPGAVNNFNAFNSEIAEKRVINLINSTIDICFNHSNSRGNHPGIVINLLGDFISGELHPELAKTDEYARIPAALRVRDLLVWAIEEMADKFGNVFLPCASGNHGRDTPKPEYKGYLYHNFDWLIYQLLDRHFEDDKRVRFLIDSSNEAYYSVYGIRFIGIHADMLGVRGGDGIIGAIGPIMRGEIKTRSQSTSLGRPYDVLLGAHWHQMLWLPRAVINNSLKGFDEYAKNKLRAVPSEPSQCLFFVHPRRGMNQRWEILVDEPKQRESVGWVAIQSNEDD